VERMSKISWKKWKFDKAEATFWMTFGGVVKGANGSRKKLLRARVFFDLHREMIYADAR
jgi:hypothetical protein